MLVGSYHFLLSIQTHKKKMWTKVGQPKQGNKKIKMHYVPASETRLDYLKLEEKSN